MNLEPSNQGCNAMEAIQGCPILKLIFTAATQGCPYFSKFLNFFCGTYVYEKKNQK
jgi:hypothetical protein